MAILANKFTLEPRGYSPNLVEGVFSEVRRHGVLGSKVSRSALRTTTIGKHKLSMNRGVAPPRYQARQPTRRMPRSPAQGNRTNLLLHEPTRWRATWRAT